MTVDSGATVHAPPLALAPAIEGPEKRAADHARSPAGSPPESGTRLVAGGHAEAYSGRSPEQRKFEARERAARRAVLDADRPLARAVYVVSESLEDMLGPLPAIEDALHHGRRLPRAVYVIMADDGRLLGSILPSNVVADHPRVMRVAAGWNERRGVQ